MTIQNSSDLNLRRVTTLRTAITRTYESLVELEMTIDSLQHKKASLKRDLTDLKEGRLDRIAERHHLDAASLDFSMFTVEPVPNSQEKNAWHIPYMIMLKGDELDETMTITNSMTKMNAPGTYKLKNGEVRYL